MGNNSRALHIIRNYWGAMLNLGATTFWEEFNMNWEKMQQESMKLSMMAKTIFMAILANIVINNIDSVYVMGDGQAVRHRFYLRISLELKF